MLDRLALVRVERLLEEVQELDALRVSGRVGKRLAQVRARQIGDDLLEGEEVKGPGPDDGAADRSPQLFAVKTFLRGAVGVLVGYLFMALEMEQIAVQVVGA